MIISRKRVIDQSRPIETSRDNVGYAVDDLQLDHLDLLKVSEATLVSAVLDGAELTLWQHRPILFLSGLRELSKDVQRVKDIGYQCWSFESPLFNRENFNRCADDILCDETELAVLAIPEERSTDIVRGAETVGTLSSL
jgi:hypothetical protein